MELHYLKHSEIDFTLWDEHLEQCRNYLIYADSTYLNTMCSSWDAIVTTDYNYIMPIPIKKKMGIRYSPSTPFIQQLGIFSKAPVIHENITHQFLQLLQQKVKLMDYNFNYNNNIKSGITKNNFVLPLRSSYNWINYSFKKDLRKDLTENEALVLVTHYTTDEAINFFQQQYQQRLTNLTIANFEALKKLANHYEKLNQCLCFAVLHNNKVVATALFWYKKNRLYNIASAITTEGKKIHANHFLYNELIKQFAETDTLLDFEGSDVEGIATFYKQFGSENIPYQGLIYNNLPWFIKLLQ